MELHDRYLNLKRQSKEIDCRICRLRDDFSKSNGCSKESAKAQNALLLQIETLECEQRSIRTQMDGLLDEIEKSGSCRYSTSEPRNFSLLTGISWEYLGR